MGKKAQTEASGWGSRLKGRLKGVRKRKQARRSFACDAMAFKMRLVRTKGKGER